MKKKLQIGRILRVTPKIFAALFGFFRKAKLLAKSKFKRINFLLMAQGEGRRKPYSKKSFAKIMKPQFPDF